MLYVCTYAYIYIIINYYLLLVDDLALCIFRLVRNSLELGTENAFGNENLSKNALLKGFWP